MASNDSEPPYVPFMMLTDSHGTRNGTKILAAMSDSTVSAHDLIMLWRKLSREDRVRNQRREQLKIVQRLERTVEKRLQRRKTHVSKCGDFGVEKGGRINRTGTTTSSKSTGYGDTSITGETNALPFPSAINTLAVGNQKKKVARQVIGMEDNDADNASNSSKGGACAYPGELSKEDLMKAPIYTDIECSDGEEFDEA